MSRDEVDNLQAAEDHIGVLEHGIRQALERLQLVALHPVAAAAEAAELLRSTLGDGYCRLDCANGECDDDCGCQAHDGDHPGWGPRHLLDGIYAEFGVQAVYDSEEPFVLVEQHADTNERYLTCHVDVDSATKYSAGQEDGYRPIALFNLDNGERWMPTVQRVVELALLDATEIPA